MDMDMLCKDDPLVRKIRDLYDKISALESLAPSDHVNALFSQLVAACIPPTPIHVSHLCPDAMDMRSRLIPLCGRAEGLLERHYSNLLTSLNSPLAHLTLFPYYSNYVKLAALEAALLRPHLPPGPARIAFLGSGPLPLTSIILAREHFRSAVFHNFDVDPSANAMAARLVGPDPDLSERMIFHTEDAMDLCLKEYDVVFLAALVGVGQEEKGRVVERVAGRMAPGAVLVARSASGARAFLYPVVEPRHLKGFVVLSVWHPADEVINSVIVARMCPEPEHQLAAEQGQGPLMVCGKCVEVPSFNPQVNFMEELAVDQNLC